MLPLPIQSDAQLVRRTLRGHRDAFSLLVERHQELVFAVAYGIVAHAADAEDVTQEAFLTAFDKLPSLREPAKFRAWLLTIARNRCADVVVKRRREAPLEDPDTTEAPAGDTLADAELRALLRERIERLPAEHREILLLHYYADLKIREIAVHLEISHEAAKKRLQRARDLLSQRMLVQLRDTVEEQGTSAARCKTIVAAIAGTSVAWQSAATVSSAGAGILSSALVAKLAVCATVAAGVVVAMVATNQEPEPPTGGDVTVVTPTSENVVVARAVIPPEPLPVVPSPDPPEETVGQDRKPAGGGVVKGRVVDTAGAPQAGILVSADVRTLKFTDHHQTTSDEEGRFEFTDVAPDFMYLIQGFGDNLFAAGEIKSRQPEDAPDDEVITLIPAGDLSGIVTDNEGNPIPDVSVAPYKAPIDGKPEHVASWWQRLRSVKTDDNGRFTIHHAWLGNWTPELDSPTHAYKLAENLEPTQSPHTIELEAGAVVSGRVVYTGTDDPVPGLELSMDHEREATTDGEGRFHFAGVAGSAGRVALRNNDTLVVTSEPFALFPGRETKAVKVEVAVGGKIRGRVTDATTREPIYGATVSFRTQSSAHSTYDASTDQDGIYEVNHLMPGTYFQARVSDSQYLTLREEDANPIQIDFGVTVDEINFELSQGVALMGQVDFPADESRDEIMVYARYKQEGGNNSARGTGFSRGEGFKISGLPEFGSVTVQLEGPGWTSNRAGPFSLSEGDISNITLIAKRVNVGSIAGQVLQGAGMARAGETVWVRSTDGRRSPTEESDEDGFFRFTNLAPGAYNLGIFGNHATDREVTVAPGQDVRGIIIDLSRGTGKISGRVLDWHGAPLAGTRIRAFGGRARIPHVTSDEKGNYTLGGLGESPVSLLVQAEGFASEERKNVMPDSRDVEFKLKPLGAVEGTILDARTGQPVTEFEVRSAHGATPGRIDNALKSAQQMTRQISPDGAFRATGLAPVEQAIVARASGYFGGHAITTVRPGETVTGVVIRLEPAPRLQARVVDGNDMPVADAKLFINDLPHTFDNDHAYGKRTRTDGDGLVPLENLLPGTNEIYVYHPEKGRGIFQVDTNRDSGVVPFELAAPARLEGTITIDGKPVEYTRLTLQFPPEAGPEHFARYMVEVNTDGSYVLEGLLAGRATARIESKGRNKLVPVYLEAGATTTLNLDIASGSSVIEIAPILPPSLANVLVNASATIETADGQTIMRAGMDAAGLIHLKDVPAGRATILVIAGQDGARHVGRTLIREIGEGETIAETVNFTDGATLSGTVSGVGPDLEVYAMLFAGIVDPALLTNDGFELLQRTMTHQSMLAGDQHYQFDAVAPGTHTIVIVTDGFVRYVHQVVEVGMEDLEIDLALP